MSNSIISRPNGNTTVVTVAAIKDVGDLAYAMGFLANHRLYKMSKEHGGVSHEDASEVAEAFLMAADRFNEEVLARLNPEAAEGTISNLGLGQIENPYHFI